jgi:hypothetical protein
MQISGNPFHSTFQVAPEKGARLAQMQLRAGVERILRRRPATQPFALIRKSRMLQRTQLRQERMPCRPDALGDRFDVERLDPGMRLDVIGRRPALPFGPFRPDACESIDEESPAIPHLRCGLHPAVRHRRRYRDSR